MFSLSYYETYFLAVIWYDFSTLLLGCFFATLYPLDSLKMGMCWSLNNRCLNYVRPHTCSFQPPQKIFSCPPVSLCFAFMDSSNLRLKTIFSICCWESVDSEGRLYALLYSILCKRVKQLWSLLSTGVLGPRSPAYTKGLSSGSIRSYMGIFYFTEFSFPSPCFVQVSTVLSLPALKTLPSKGPLDCFIFFLLIFSNSKFCWELNFKSVNKDLFHV